MATTCFHKRREDEVHSPWQLLEVEGAEHLQPRCLQPGWYEVPAGMATQCSHHHCVPSPWGSSCSTPNSRAHHCPMYLQHLFVNVSMSFIKPAVSPSCGWMATSNILEILSVLVWEGLDKRRVCFWVLSGHFRLIRQLSRSEQQCLCNFIPAD